MNLKPAATQAHYVFCYPAVAHTSTQSVDLAFGPKLGFKNKWRARDRFGLAISGLGRCPASKWGPFTILLSGAQMRSANRSPVQWNVILAH